MQTLGGYTFYWNPDVMSIPEKQKTVAITATYGGSAIFEWSAILQGTKVVLEWEFMPRGMYKQLRIMYLQVGTTFIWNPEVGGNTYNVKIANLEGEYFQNTFYDSKWRRNVKMTFDVRSLSAVLQSTSTTTTSTTTTV